MSALASNELSKTAKIVLTLERLPIVFRKTHFKIINLDLM